MKRRYKFINWMAEILGASDIIDWDQYREVVPAKPYTGPVPDGLLKQSDETLINKYPGGSPFLNKFMQMGMNNDVNPLPHYEQPRMFPKYINPQPRIPAPNGRIEYLTPQQVIDKYGDQLTEDEINHLKVYDTIRNRKRSGESGTQDTAPNS